MDDYPIMRSTAEYSLKDCIRRYGEELKNKIDYLQELNTREQCDLIKERDKWQNRALKAEAELAKILGCDKGNAILHIPQSPYGGVEITASTEKKEV